VTPGSDRAAQAAERALMREADACWAPEPHVCGCCGEQTDTGEDCCSDDFPEPGDVRETGR
jgi:hypothetical protein